MWFGFTKNALMNEIRRKSDLAVQNQDDREEKLWWKRFGFFFSKPNHSSCENLLEGWAVSLSRRQQESSEVCSYSSSSSLTAEIANKSFVLRMDEPFYFPLFYDRESCLIQKMVMFLVVPMTESETQKRKADVSVPREWAAGAELWFGFEKKKPNLFDHNFSSR